MLSFWALCAAGLLGRLSYEMLRTPVTTLFAKHLGAPTELIGLIVGAVTITGIFLKFPSGTLADVFGFRRILISGLVVKATAPFIYLFVVSWPQLLALRFYHGLSTALYAPAAAALVASDFPKQRASRLGTYSAFENAGVILGPLLGAALIVGSDFGRAFWVSGGIGIFSLIAVLFVPSAIRSATRSTAEGPRSLATRLLVGVREIAGDPAIRTVALVEGTMYFGIGTLQAYLPLYAQTDAHLAVNELGILFGAQGIASIVGRPLWGRAADRTGRRPLIVIGIVLCALTLAAMSFATSFFVLVGLNIIFGLGTGMVTPATTALIGDVAKRNNVGTAMGVFGSLWDIGHASGPIIAGFLIAALDYRIAFSIVSVAILLTLLPFLASPAVRRVEREMRASQVGDNGQS
jgi:MFS family permease